MKFKFGFNSIVHPFWKKDKKIVLSSFLKFQMDWKSKDIYFIQVFLSVNVLVKYTMITVFKIVGTPPFTCIILNPPLTLTCKLFSILITSIACLHVEKILNRMCDSTYLLIHIKVLPHLSFLYNLHIPWHILWVYFPPDVSTQLTFPHKNRWVIFMLISI